MKHTNLKSAYYTSQKFEGAKEFYIIEDKNDLNELIKAFPQLKNSWRIIRLRIKDIISDGYVALVTDIKPKSNCVELAYENLLSHKYSYDDAHHRV
jgi:hypothetical protein